MRTPPTSPHATRLVRTASCSKNPSRARVPLTADYVGFTVLDEWLIGYGLDAGKIRRTLPYIAAVDPAA